MTDTHSLIEQMTLEEKAALCTGASAWTTRAVERLGIPEVRLADGPHGVRRVAEMGAQAEHSLPATCFPTASCLASTWDRDLLHAVGQALGEECAAQGVDVLLGPGINMKRTPLGGRNFEYYSEDPCLAGEMATHWIRGVQSQGTGASLKHFAANNQEFQRFSINVGVDERALREIYLAAFETAVKKAEPWTVMCAYNRLNGAYCSENHELLVEILKNEWGFAGPVVSDWGAVHDRVAALVGGLDLEMPGPQERRVKAVVEAVRRGELDEAVLDGAVRRILEVAFKTKRAVRGGSFDAAAHHALAKAAAAEGMVLLKNDGVLPLQAPQRIAVIGLAAKVPSIQGGGSSHVNPTRVSVPWEELKNQAGRAELTYSAGYPAGENFQQALIDEAVQAAQAADAALLFIALPASKEVEGYDRPDLDLTPQQVALIQAVARVQPRNVVILNNGSALAMEAWIGGAGAVLEAWLMGQAGAEAVVDILFGKINPSGKLSETFPRKLADTPAYLNYPGENGEVRYGEGLFTGYRYYDAKEMPVLFPFGYGGSYTTFAYSALRLSSRAFRDADGLRVAVDITNTGEMAGEEVVQLYVHDHKSRLVRPPKELKGFARLALQPGETQTAAFVLDFRSFAYYHPGYRQWITEDGEFDILIGASAGDIRVQETVTLQSTLELPSLLDIESTVREWLEDPSGKAILEPLLQQGMEQRQQELQGDESAQEALQMDWLGALDMPLLSVLRFQEQSLPFPAEELVMALLAQVHSAKEFSS